MAPRYIWASAIASIVRPNLPQGSSIDVLPYQGGIGNPMLLAKGKADIALSFLPCTVWAYNGLAPYKKADKELRSLVGGLSRPHRIGVMIRKASGITLPGRGGQEETPGQDRDRPARRHRPGRVHAALERVRNHPPEKLEKWGGKIEHLRMPVAMGRIKDGHADIVIHNVGFKEPRFSELSLTTEIFFDEVPADIRATMGQEVRLPGQPGHRKRREFRGVDKNVTAIGYPTSLIATSKLSDQMAYIITKAVV